MCARKKKQVQNYYDIKTKETSCYVVQQKNKLEQDH